MVRSGNNQSEGNEFAENWKGAFHEITFPVS